jgi:PPM family protein phosphatase
MFDQTATVSSTYEVAPVAPAHTLSVGHATHRGLVREVNEDDHALALDLGFFVVADGVGGSPGGAVAARLATAAMISGLRYSSKSKVGSDGGAEDSGDETAAHSARVVAAAHQAHQMIYNYGQRHRCPGAATTMVALWVVGNRVLIANTGDSRAYRLEDDGLTLLSRDHSALQEYTDRFGPVPEHARCMLENIVTRVLGGQNAQAADVHLTDYTLVGEETFLLCTDGLSKVLTEGEIEGVLSSARTPQEAADTLVDMANDAGGPDNITCIVLRVSRDQINA